MELIIDSEVRQPAQRVWSLWADFGNLEWLADTFCRVDTEGQGIGMLRYLYRTPAGGADIHRLDAIDHEAMEQACTILQSSFIHVTEHRYWVKVTPLSAERCRVCVTVRCTPVEGNSEAEVAAVLTAWTEAALHNLDHYLDALPR